jgi:serine/threonine-protein kinase
MNARRALPVALASFVSLAALAPDAHAEASKADQRAAQKLFDEGLDLLEHDHAAEACPKLEESQRLDPGMGTAFRLGECYAATGRLVRAAQLYREVAAEAKAAKSAAREQVATERADEVAARTPKLVVELTDAARVPGLSVRVDDAALEPAQLGNPMPLDPGDHEVSASAPGFVSWSSRVHLAPRGEAHVPIPALAAEPRAEAPHAAPEPVAPPPPASPPSSFGGQRVAALAVAGLGVAGVAVGTVFGLQAKSKWNDTLGRCQGGATDKCDATGVSLGGDAKTAATISTVSFVAGGVGLAGALVLWLTAPSGAKTEPVRVTPIAGAGTFGAACTGAF